MAWGGLSASRPVLGEFTRGKLKVTDLPIITVIGKAFWDIGHAPKRWIKPEKAASRLRRLGIASRDEGDSSMTKAAAHTML
jgi:hypothetical protein